MGAPLRIKHVIWNLGLFSEGTQCAWYCLCVY